MFFSCYKVNLFSDDKTDDEAGQQILLIVYTNTVLQLRVQTLTLEYQP